MFEGAPWVPDHPLQGVLSEVELGSAVDLAPGDGDLVTRGVVVDQRSLARPASNPSLSSYQRVGNELY